MGCVSPGNLYLDVERLPNPLYRTDGYEVMTNILISPCEAALRAVVVAPTVVCHARNLRRRGLEKNFGRPGG
jgi:DnaJ-class molecular chaperone